MRRNLLFYECIRLILIATSKCSIYALALVHSKLLILLQFSSSWVLSTMRVPQDVHATKRNQTNALACSIASSHEDLHEMTPISSRVGQNSQSVSPSIVSRNGSLLGIPIITAWIILIDKNFPKKFDCWTANCSMDKSVKNLRINFGLHQAVFHVPIKLFSSSFFTNSSSVTMFFTSASSVTTFW